MEKKIEILAPAGSFETLKAAVLNGADAVYAGGNRFGARAYAVNFTEEELLEAIDYIHLHGRKIYLTVNTLVKENEFVKREIGSYMLLRIQFVFFNFEEPLIFFLLDYAAVMGLFVFIGHYLTEILKYCSRKRQMQPADNKRFPD